jgi:SAM-dependent methyltransferase
MTGLRARAKGSIPPPVLRVVRVMDRAIRRIHGALVDSIESVRGRDGLTPPRSMIFVGGGDFRKVGEEFRRYFVDLGHLHPDDRVLDVGCGIGRMAVPLTRYLSPQGEYWGFDVVREGIDWCTSAIARPFPNFHFEHADIFNKHYNPAGTHLASAYRFPHEDASIDFAFLTSVFTHLLPPDMDNYLRELSRVMRPGGRCLMTLFLLNDESRGCIRHGSSQLDFAHAVDGCLTIDADDPEAALAYAEDAVRARLAAVRLRIDEPIRFGSWCGRPSYLSYQDIILATKGE